jgi:hypothetical protein
MFGLFKPRPKLFSIDRTTKAMAARVRQRQHCHCLDNRTKGGAPSVPNMHIELQDESLTGWNATVDLIARSAEGQTDVFEPLAHVAWDDWIKVITLPASVATLAHVRKIRLYASHLRRLPPEIGRITALEDLDAYTSYSLHWLPYEVLRCKSLRDSRMSTRALYGNRKTLLPFPRLAQPIEAVLPSTCSVCDRVFDRSPHLFWTTQRVGTDYVPLLLHSCSKDCTLSVPNAPNGFFERPHKGGGGVGMPMAPEL